MADVYRQLRSNSCWKGLDDAFDMPLLLWAVGVGNVGLDVEVGEHRWVAIATKSEPLSGLMTRATPHFRIDLRISRPTARRARLRQRDDQPARRDIDIGVERVAAIRAERIYRRGVDHLRGRSAR